MELLKLTAKIDVVHVPYKGAPQALTDVIGGQIPISGRRRRRCCRRSSPGACVRSRVTSLKRIPQLPSVPTMDESALPGFEVTSWYGLCAPAGTPAPILEKVHADLMTVLRCPRSSSDCRTWWSKSRPTSPQEFAQFIRAETARWARVIKAAGIPQE